MGFFPFKSKGLNDNLIPLFAAVGGKRSFTDNGTSGRFLRRKLLGFFCVLEHSVLQVGDYLACVLEEMEKRLKSTSWLWEEEWKLFWTTSSYYKEP